jgi:tripartite-type tricarboxylate transporter receptor subunit TctC
MTSKFFLTVILFAVVVLITSSSKAIEDDFYRGKRVRFVVMTSPGGGYDTYARAIARHLGKHIPGNPSVIVQNMPGAGGLIATHHLYNVAEPNGLTIGMVNSGIIVWQAVGMEQIRYDTRRFGWLGAPGEAIPVCAIMGFTGLKNLNEVLKSEKPLSFGSAGTSTYQQPVLLKTLLNADIKVVEGYTGTAGIRAALQRKEADGACWQWDSMKTTAREMLDAKGENRLIPFLVEGTADDREVRDLPQYSDVIKGDENMALFDAWMSQYRVYRPLVVPPNTPKSRLEILRSALKQTLVSLEFRAMANKMDLEIKHLPGTTIETYVNRTLAISPAIKDKLRPIVLR